MVGYILYLCFVNLRRHFSSACLPQPFHLLPTHGILSLTPSLLFIRPWTNQRPWPRTKTQYIILGPYPYKGNKVLPDEIRKLKITSCNLLNVKQNWKK